MEDFDGNVKYAHYRLEDVTGIVIIKKYTFIIYHSRNQDVTKNEVKAGFNRNAFMY